MADISGTPTLIAVASRSAEWYMEETVSLVS